MAKKRVEKGEKYFYIDCITRVCTATEYNEDIDDELFNKGNYFLAKEDADVVACKFRSVLAGAGVIQMPSEEELKQKADEHAISVFHKYNDEEINEQTCKDSFLESIEWLKSKIK